MVSGATPDVRDSAEDLLALVVDPEIPNVSILDLGMVRGIEVDGDRVTVTITPTYLGCPALGMIRAEILRVLSEASFTEVEVRTVYSPAWSTTWISPEGRKRLRDAGIAPPGDPACPNCGSGSTAIVSLFGSTACKALLACTACGEPFHHFKALV